MKYFAPNYERNDQGWVKFPSDVSYRKELFPEEVMTHPAKSNIYLIEEIVRYVSEPDEMIMDIMAGTGTIMVAALLGRQVMCLEISPNYYEIQKKALAKLESRYPGVGSCVSLLNIPCQTILPIPNTVDHIVFSPPYSAILKQKDATSSHFTRFVAGGGKYNWDEYHAQALNVGALNDFLWAQEMEKIYGRCYQTIKPGGTITIIIKDHIEKGRKVGLPLKTQEACTRCGFVADSWFTWDAPGAYTEILRTEGVEPVDYEDIITLRRP
jgi:DNA modification methylase